MFPPLVLSLCANLPLSPRSEVHQTAVQACDIRLSPPRNPGNKPWMLSLPVFTDKQTAGWFCRGACHRPLRTRNPSAPRKDGDTPMDFRIEPCRQWRADLHHRQAHFGAVDQSGARQPVLGRRRARLGEQQLGQTGNAVPARQRRIGIALLQEGPHRRENVGLDMRRQQDGAIGAVAERLEILRVLAGQDPEAGRPATQEIDRLRAVGAAILQADDVRMFGEPQQRRRCRD